MSSKYQEMIPKNGKYDNQKQLKDIIEADMISTPEEFTDNSLISHMTSTPLNI